jgi:tetratricopeptide (TPR) repeat protein
LLSASNQQEKLKMALQDQTKAIQLSPGKSTYWLNRAVTHFKLKNFNYALQDLISAERLDPENPEIYFYKSSIFFNLGQFEKAQPEIEKYLTLDPSNSDMWTNLGEASRLNKQYDRSVNAFNKAIQLNPDKLLYYNSRLKTYYEMGDIERARNDLQFLKLKGFKDINPDYEKMINQGK